MKPIPTIEELIEIARRDAKHYIYSVKEEQFADSISAPLFAAIQERDGEIERLRGLLSQAHAEARLLNTFPDLRSSVKQSAENIAKYLGWAIKQTKPAKPQPETFEAHGETWTRHTPGDLMPVDGLIRVICLAQQANGKLVQTAPDAAENFAWHVKNPSNYWWGVIIGYRLADEAKPDKSETCEHCGGSNIQQSGCPRCGAPVCCDDCCKQATQEFARPDPHAHLKEAEAQGKLIQCNTGTRDHPNWVDIQAGCKFAFSPEDYRVKPWELPSPPEGRQWHRVDGWTEDMLRPGERPLLLGEIRQKGDEYQYQGDTVWGPCQVFAEPSTMADEFYRTRRPLPEPATWIDLGPEDVPPGSVFRLADSPSRHWYQANYVTKEGVSFSDDFVVWRDLNKYGAKINRSLPLTGKWDAEAWEPCRKLKA